MKWLIVALSIFIGGCTCGELFFPYPTCEICDCCRWPDGRIECVNCRPHGVYPCH